MQKFLVLYMAPVKSLEDWMKLDEAVRKEDEATMKAAWDAWMQSHANVISGMHAGVGKTKRVTKDGVSDVKNEVMMSSMIEGDSHEAVAALFENHPHFGIPDAWIEVMPLHVLAGVAEA